MMMNTLDDANNAQLTVHSIQPYNNGNQSTEQSQRWTELKQAGKQIEFSSNQQRTGRRLAHC